MYRGKEIFKPLNTGWIDENVACVREWVANIFFYRKGDTTIMIDAGYNYDRLAEKMGWLGILVVVILLSGVPAAVSPAHSRRPARRSARPLPRCRTRRCGSRCS